MREPCFTDSDENRFPDETDEYVIKSHGKESDKCACELSAHINVFGLCRLWDSWRDSTKLKIMLHGFLMISGLTFFDAAWKEIDFLYDMVNGEHDD